MMVRLSMSPYSFELPIDYGRDGDIIGDVLHECQACAEYGGYGQAGETMVSGLLSVNFTIAMMNSTLMMAKRKADG